MTPIPPERALAEKIMTLLNIDPKSNFLTDIGNRQAVEAELREAMEEAYNEGLKAANKVASCDECKREAYTRAAEFVRNCSGLSKKEIAAEIEALARGEKSQ